MIQLGVIGTSWISHQFVQAAISTKQYELTGVYSRSLTKAQDFGRLHTEVAFYSDDLTSFLKNKTIDTVYIASPNSLHFEQAVAAIQQGKHVIIEKPACSNPKELQEIIERAKQNGVYFFEAARNIHEENFALVKEYLETAAPIQGASLTYMKYSARYDEVLRGQQPNIFSPKFSGGALMDLGVYLVYAAIAWFGVPQSVDYFANKVTTGVDGSGIGVLHYDTYDVVLNHGKTVDSFAKSEIYLEDGTLVLDGVNKIKEAIVYERFDQSENYLALQTEKDNPLFEEAHVFASIIAAKNREVMNLYYQELVTLAENVNQVMYEMRKKAGIIFPADYKE